MTSSILGLPDGSDCSWFGQLFIMMCYGFILFKAAVLIGDGSEKLLLVYGPGVIGGLVIPVLGAIPDGAIVLVSGLGSDAQCEVSTGMGTLAGSTIMLLTLPWSCSLFLGCRDRAEDGTAASKPNGRPKYEDGFKPFSSCITTYANTVTAAKLMMATSVSYLIVLIPAIIYKNASSSVQIEVEHYPALTGFIVCSVLFIAYSVFQVYDSRATTLQEMEQTRLNFQKWQKSVGQKVANNGDAAIKLAFEKFDVNRDGTISRAELQAGFRMLGLELDRNETLQLMREYQGDDDDDDDKETLTEREFTDAIKKWSRTLLSRQSKSGTQQHSGSASDADLVDSADEKERVELQGVPENDATPLMSAGKKASYDGSDGSAKDNDDAEEKTAKETEKEALMASLWRDLNMERDDATEEDEMMELSHTQLMTRALIELSVGAALVCIMSDPMVDVIDNFADTINVDSFYVSFLVTPLASNAAEIYASMVFASRRTTEGVSMGFNALYGAGCMNNTFVLCIFCALVYFQELQWTFIAETIVILFTIVVVGLNGMRPTVTVWQGFLVIALFPLSIVLVYFLNDVLDDSTDC